MENIYTDLALETAENLNEQGGEEIDGVDVHIEDREDIRITKVSIRNENGAETMRKPIGDYTTIESPRMRENDPLAHEEIMGILASELAKLCIQAENETVLVIGLGNRYVTPDALGPKVISKILITRHIMDSLPSELIGGVRPVCAISPGVMGATGLETAEVAEGIVSLVKPSLIIAIDALAARKVSRINSTIQMSNTGITPGAGVGNVRRALNMETLGVPVIAIGVPTVADAATFTSDTMDAMLEAMLQNTPKEPNFAAFIDMLSNMREQEKYNAVKKSLGDAASMFVTPKEIGEVVDFLSNIIANGINMAMHQGIDREDINRYV